MKNISDEDLSVLKRISKIKWMYRFKCKGCGCKDYYKLKDYSRKCAKCKKKESVTTQTAFDGLRMPISNALDILLRIRDRYYGFVYEVPTDINQLYFKGQYIRYEGYDDLKQDPLRFSTYDIRDEFGISQTAAWSYLNRIIEWLPKSYWRKKSETEIYPAWFQSIRRKNRPRYYALFNLLFHEEGWKRDSGDIIHILVHKRRCQWDFHYDTFPEEYN